MLTPRPAAEALADPAGAGALGAPVTTLGAPVEALRASAAALETGAEGPARTRAALIGVGAGVAFVLVELLSVTLILGAAPRAALRNLPAAAAGDASVLIVTLAGVFTIVLAAAYGALVAVVTRRYSRTTAWWTGAVSGLTVYVVNFYYLLAPALRWFGELRDQVSVLSPWYLVSLWP